MKRVRKASAAMIAVLIVSAVVQTYGRGAGGAGRVWAPLAVDGRGRLMRPDRSVGVAILTRMSLACVCHAGEYESSA